MRVNNLRFKPDRRQRQNTSQAADQATDQTVIVARENLPQPPLLTLHEAPVISVPQKLGNVGDSHTESDLDAPLTRKDILAIVKAVMDSMPGASIDQLPDEMDIVERAGELDIILCCKIV